MNARLTVTVAATIFAAYLTVAPAYLTVALLLGACIGVALGQLGNHLLSRDPKERHERR